MRQRREEGGIGAGTGPAGPAMAGPFSSEVETKYAFDFCVVSFLD